MRFPSPRYIEPAQGLSILTVTVLINVGVFFLQTLGPPVVDAPGALSHARLADGEWWTVLTHVFMHGSLLHLSLNMLLLLLAGRTVQRLAGPQNFAYIFLFSAWAGAAVCLFSTPNVQLFGASGGVMGVLGAWCAFHARENVLEPLRRWLPVSLHLRGQYLWLGLVLACLIMESIRRTQPAQDMDTAHLVHAAALVTGWACALAMQHRAASQDDGLGAFIAALQAEGKSRQRNPVHAVREGAPDEEKDQPKAGTEPLSDTAFMREIVDPVLEKIHSNGKGSLSVQDREILKEAARRMEKR